MSPSPCFSIGVRNTSLKRRMLPSRPGIRKSNCAYSSPSWFPSGVPVSDRRCRATSSRAAARLGQRVEVIVEQRGEIVLERDEGGGRAMAMRRM